MFKKQKIKGKVVAITGAARGIGLATAEALIAQGAKVSIGDIDLALAEKEGNELVQKHLESMFVIVNHLPHLFKIPFSTMAVFMRWLIMQALCRWVHF